MDLDRAVEVFVRAFAYGKSLSHPYLAEQVGDLWVMRDGPGRKIARKMEVINHRLSPAGVHEQVSKSNLGWHFLCDIRADLENFDQIRNEYKRLGYRAVATEWMFTHSLETLPDHKSIPPALEVASKAELAQIKQRAGQPRKWQANTRLYGIWDNERDYGWVSSVPVGSDAWVSGLYVYREVRGQGYGRALMTALLRADKRERIENSVLLASTAGARLYPWLGYQQIGILQMFCPKEKY